MKWLSKSLGSFKRLKKIRSNEDSGKPVYAVLASIFLGDIALPFWVKCGYSFFWGMALTLVFATIAYFNTFLFAFLSVHGLLDWIKWDWFVNLKTDWVSLTNGYSYFALYLVGLLPSYFGGVARLPTYGYISMMPFNRALIMLIAIFLGIWTRLIATNLSLEETIIGLKWLKRKIKKCKSPNNLFKSFRAFFIA